MNDDDVQHIERLAAEGDIQGVIRELARLADAGRLRKGALRVSLADGQVHEVVFGARTQQERELLLASLHAKVVTKH